MTPGQTIGVTRYSALAGAPPGQATEVMRYAALAGAQGPGLFVTAWAGPGSLGLAALGALMRVLRGLGR